MKPAPFLGWFFVLLVVVVRWNPSAGELWESSLHWLFFFLCCICQSHSRPASQHTHTRTLWFARIVWRGVTTSGRIKRTPFWIIYGEQQTLKHTIVFFLEFYYMHDGKILLRTGEIQSASRCAEWIHRGDVCVKMADQSKATAQAKEWQSCGTTGTRRGTESENPSNSTKC